MFSRSSPCQMGEVWSWFPTTTSNDFFGFSLWCRKNPISGVRTGKHTMFGPDSFEQMGVSQNVVSHINPQFIGPIEMEQKWWCLLPLDLGKKHVTPCSDKAFSLGKKNIRYEARVVAKSPSRRASLRSVPGWWYGGEDSQLISADYRIVSWAWKIGKINPFGIQPKEIPYQWYICIYIYTVNESFLANHSWLVVFRLPLWKMMEWVTVGMMTFHSQYDGENKKCSKPPTRFPWIQVVYINIFWQSLWYDKNHLIISAYIWIHRDQHIDLANITQARFTIWLFNSSPWKIISFNR